MELAANFPFKNVLRYATRCTDDYPNPFLLTDYNLKVAKMGADLSYWRHQRSEINYQII